MKKQKTPKEYEQLGRVVSSIFDSGYLDKKQAYKTSFIKGLFGGLGGAVGATVLLALLIWVLTLFGRVPLIGHFVDNINETVQSAKR